MTKSILAAGMALLAAVTLARPVPEAKPDLTAEAWGEVRITPERTPAVEFAIAPSNREVAFYGYARAFYLYDIAANKVRLQVECDDSVNDLTYSPDGKWIVTPEWSGGFQLRDARTGASTATLTPPDGLGPSAARFLSDGKLATYSWRSQGQGAREQLGLWNVAAKKMLGWPTTERAENNGELVRSRFVAGGNQLNVTTRYENGIVTKLSVTVTDPLTGTASPVVNLGVDDYVLDASADGKTLLVFNPQRSPRMIEVASGLVQRELFGGHRHYVICGAFSPDGKLVATASGTQFRTNVLHRNSKPPGPSEIILWDAATGNPIAKCPAPDSDKEGFANIKFSPDGRMIAAAVGKSDQPGGKEMKGGHLMMWGKFTSAEAGTNAVAVRFLDRGDHVEDKTSGLLWQKDGIASGQINYYGAIRYAAELELGGHVGWRLPTATELAAIFPATAKPFTNTRYDAVKPRRGERADYWTSEIDRTTPDAALIYPWCPGEKPTSTSASQTLSFARCVHDPIKK